MKLRNRKIPDSVVDNKEDVEKISNKTLKNKPEPKAKAIKKPTEKSSKPLKSQLKLIQNEIGNRSEAFTVQKEETSPRPSTSRSEDVRKIEFNKPPVKKVAKNLSSDSESDFEEVSSVAITKNNLPRFPIKKSPKKVEIIEPCEDQIKIANIESMLRIETINNFKINNKATDEMMSVDDDCDDEDGEEEFEEVEMERELDMATLKNSEPIEINITDGKAKKKVDLAAKMERMIRALNKKFGIQMVKSHLVCWLAHGFYLNRICLSDLVRATALSILDQFNFKNFQLINFDQNILDKCLKIIRKKSEFKNTDTEFLTKSLLVTEESLCQSMVSLKFDNYLHYILVVLILMRSLSIKARLCVCFDVYELDESFKKEKANKDSLETKSKASKRRSESKIEGKSMPKKKQKSAPNLQETGKGLASKLSKLEDDESEIEESTNEARTSKRKSKLKQVALKKDQGSDSSDYEREELKKNLQKKKPLVKKNSKVLSSDETEEEKKPKTNIQRETCAKNYWLEVYLEGENKWISVEPMENKSHLSCENFFEERFGKQILYVCGFDGDNRVKEVTKRYASKWTTSARFLRIDFVEKKLWWKRTLMYHETLDANLDAEEEKQLTKMLLDQGLPASVSELKDHPLYVLKRHLLKFQAIYPNEATPVGYLRNEAVYSRENLHTLHSRQTWLKYARTVKPYEKPFKVVKGRIKMSDYKNGCRENPELDIYGWWQTKPYDPPVAENGRVPLNEFGNVELFQPCMLPIGTVHLRNMPNLNRICRKLNIECAAAVTGFDAHGGFSHAVMDGWVVCEEHKDTVVAAFEEEEVRNNLKMIEKQQERVWGNWRHLIKSLLIRQKLKLKYGS